VLGCFLAGLVTDSVDWRGHPLRVLAGSRIERPAAQVEPEIESVVPAA
jgi:hypothetical protein